MKKLLSFAVLLFGIFTVFAQSPEKMSYQAVVRNTSGQLLQSQNVAVKASILQGSATGTVVYSERLTGTTNANGLLTTEIGGGTVLSGTFSTIDWSSGNYYLKTETDPNGGTNYTIVGTSQLLSVPYAMYAKNAGGIGSSQWAANGNDIYNSNSGNVGIGTNIPWTKFNVKTDNLGIVQESQDGNVILGFYTDSNTAYLLTLANNDLNFSTNGQSAQLVLQKGTGNLGVGNSNPAEKLEVNGKTKTTNLQVTSGASTGKVLTSDAAGNATWQTPSTSTGVINQETYTSAYFLTNTQGSIVDLPTTNVTVPQTGTYLINYYMSAENSVNYTWTPTGDSSPPRVTYTGAYLYNKTTNGNYRFEKTDFLDEDAMPGGVAYRLRNRNISGSVVKNLTAGDVIGFKIGSQTTGTVTGSISGDTEIILIRLR